MSKRKKARNIIIIVLVVLVAFRLYLPTLVKNYINKTLENIPGYWGHVNDIDISLIRGAYIIHELKLDKVTGKTNVPFLEFQKTDISIQWHSLIRGKIVSEINMYRPKVNYVFEDQQKNDTIETSNEDWTAALKNIVPIDINKLQVTNGKIAFIQFSKKPDVDLYIDQINLNATNLRNVVDKEKRLPSSIHATGISIGKGHVKLDGNMNSLKQIPDLDLDFSLQKAQATGLNSFTRAYAGIDFEKGQFDLFSELVIKDGYLKGYFKPIFTKLKILDSFKKKDSSIFKKLWEGFVGIFKFLFENHKKDTLATKIPVEGDLNNIDSNVWATIGGIFKNAFIKAFNPDVDKSIDFKDVSVSKK
ncbi:DUF748 domain-containing protein [Zhouia sp. PK063]|uniref:DUF748 domain-containing protein n=1 Tax=Zhouia sp. PK063 TaxID=3373602 RepID=UPI00379CF6FF